MNIVDQNAFSACLSGSLEKAAIAGRATPAKAMRPGGPFADPASGASARVAADHGAEDATVNLSAKHWEQSARLAPESQWTGSPSGATAAIPNLMTGVFQ